MRYRVHNVDISETFASRDPPSSC